MFLNKVIWASGLLHIAPHKQLFVTSASGTERTVPQGKSHILLVMGTAHTIIFNHKSPKLAQCRLWLLTQLNYIMKLHSNFCHAGFLNNHNHDYLSFSMYFNNEKYREPATMCLLLFVKSLNANPSRFYF